MFPSEAVELSQHIAPLLPEWAVYADSYLWVDDGGNVEDETWFVSLELKGTPHMHCVYSMEDWEKLRPSLEPSR